jgi:hypothetical protein
MPDAEQQVTITQFVRAFEAAVGRADRERQAVAAEAAIVAGERNLWIIDSFSVEDVVACATVAESGDDILVPREGLQVSFKFSLKRVSGQTIVKGNDNCDA